ncbi:NrsF family protein [Tsuneonella sp. SYSU-LHT278]|uniref:NrsF family protein n=1 Tax=Tsuneonella sediminis TaxID=3416089 RepID=UPI003F7B0301
MITTDDLITRLARQGPPISPQGPRQFAALIAVAGMLCLALLAATLGAPLAALPQIGTAPYAMKLGFAGSIAVISAAAAYRAALPGRRVGRSMALLALCFVAIAVLAMLEVVSVGPLWPGSTWARCVSAIVILGSGIFAALVFAMRRLAPTRPPIAGGLAGLAAGGLAATVYGLWCPETSALFLASWYALPILALGLLGAGAGTSLLRW